MSKGSGSQQADVSEATPVSAGEMMRFRRNQLGLSQEMASLRCGISVRNWKAMESEGAPISDYSVMVISYHLQFPREDREQFLRLATGTRPAFKGIRDRELDSVTQRWLEAHILPLRDPAVLLDGGWNVLGNNAEWTALFEDVDPDLPDHPYVNPVDYLLFGKGAQCKFIDWADGWVLPILVQFAHHYHLNHGNPELRQLRQRIGESEVLERIFTHDVHAELIARGLERIYKADGEIRKIHVPGRGVTECRMTISIPWHGRWVGYQGIKLSSVVEGRSLVEVSANCEVASNLSKDAGSDGPVKNSLGLSGAQPLQAHAGYQKSRDPSLAVRLELGLQYPDVTVTVGQILRHYRTQLHIPQSRLRYLTPLKMSDRSYRKIEGGQALPQLADLPVISEALKIPESVTRFMHRLISGGHPPTKAVRGGEEFERQSEIWAREHIADSVQPIPTSLEDGQWNAVAHNTGFADLFSHVELTENHPTKSSFRYVFFHEDARHTLANWYEEWAIPFLVEFGAKLLENSGERHPEHARMLDDVRRDPLLRATFEGRVKAELQSGGAGTGFLIDGGIRGMNLPTPEFNRDAIAENRQFYPVLVTACAPLHSLVDFGGQTVSMEVLTDSGHEHGLTTVRPIPTVPGFVGKPGGVLGYP